MDFLAPDVANVRVSGTDSTKNRETYLLHEFGRSMAISHETWDLTVYSHLLSGVFLSRTPEKELCSVVLFRPLGERKVSGVRKE